MWGASDSVHSQQKSCRAMTHRFEPRSQQTHVGAFELLTGVGHVGLQERVDNLETEETHQ